MCTDAGLSRIGRIEQVRLAASSVLHRLGIVDRYFRTGPPKFVRHIKGRGVADIVRIWFEGHA
jgi:hypothetical protein